MAANVLNSPRAVQMSIFVVRAFRQDASPAGRRTRICEKTCRTREKELKDRLDVHEAAIVAILQRVMEIFNPPAEPPPPPKPKIGFR